MDDFADHCTPFEDYRRLFSSRAFECVGFFAWRNPVCSEAQIGELRALRPKNELQLQVIRFSSRFV